MVAWLEARNWDALAGAVAAGHVIECGTQATGGNYSFFTEISDKRRIGFPWAEIAVDGSSIIGKHPETGGEVSIGTVTSQLLYEIGSPSYLGPDVVSRFDTIRLEGLGADRVRLSGVRGEPPTGSLKVSLNMLGGFRNDLKIAVCAPNIEAKAEFLERAFWDHCPYDPADYSEASSRLIRTDKPDPKSNEEAIAIWAMTLKDPDKRKVGRAVSDAVVEMALSTTPGFFMLSGPPGSAKEFGIHASALVAAEIVDQHVTFLDGEDFGVDGSALSGLDGLVVPDEGASAKVEHGPTTQASLGSVVGARVGRQGRRRKPRRLCHVRRGVAVAR